MTAPTIAGTAVALEQSCNVAQLLLRYLRHEGVRYIFGVPGGAATHLLNELKRQQRDFQFIISRHETGAAYMAHGYSIVSETDELGVVLTTSGPAATNALTGALNAQASGTPLLTITGEVPQQFFGRGYLQEGIDARLDVDAVFKSALRYSAVVTHESNFATLFTQALRDARSIPCSAAHISLPNNISDAALPPGLMDALPGVTAPRRLADHCVDEAGIAKALAILIAAERPLLFLGNGARRALRCGSRSERLRQFVDRYAIPVMTTPDAKGIFPETNELSLRNYGMAACAWPMLYIQNADDAPYDALCVIGSQLGELSTSVTLDRDGLYGRKLMPAGEFIQIDIDPSVIGRNFPTTLGVVSEAAAAIDRLCALARDVPPPAGVDARREAIRVIKGNPPFDETARNSDAAPIHPAAVVRIMNEELQCGGHVFIDAGNCVGWSLNNMIVDPPLQYHSALGMGPMGFAVGAVIGGKLRAPEVPCVAFVGDGAFMMHGAEISTAAQNKIGAVWVVLRDNDLAMVSQGMNVLFPDSAPWEGYYKLGDPDLRMFAESLGACAVDVLPDEGPEDFRCAFRDALRRAEEDGRPQVVVVHIDPKPMPPYGWPPPKP